MNRRLAPLALILAFVLAACGMPSSPTVVAPPQEFGSVRTLTPALDPFGASGRPIEVADAPSLWFVEVDAPPLLDGGSIATLGATVSSVQAAADAAGVGITPRFTFSTFVSGFSAEVDPAGLLTLSRLPGVTRIMPVALIEPPEVVLHGTEITPDVMNARILTGVTNVYADGTGLTGQGVRVGIIDTGIALDHWEFAGRIVEGFDFVGDRYNAGGPADVRIPRPEDEFVDDPDWPNRPGGGDCNGHGTHVAGIVGSGGVLWTGVAPEVELGAYRVFGCGGSSASDVILAAIERAFADGMDIVNLSLGSANGWPQDFLSIALSRMLDSGMIPVASAGNNGAEGVATLGAPGVGDNVITVASFDNFFSFVGSFDVAGEEIGYTLADGTVLPPSEGSAQLVDVGLACEPLSEPLDGAIALAARGACTFATKGLNAEAAGASALVISNNVAGVPSFGLGGTAVGIPVVGITLADGTFIRSQLPATLTWKQLIDYVGYISTFSSYGLSPDLTLKPEIGAPGGNIFAPFIFADVGDPGDLWYAELSGTSMSAPHVAGAVALLLEARPDIARARVRDVLMNNAVPVNWRLDIEEDNLLESVHRQGAGMLRIDRAIANSVQAVPGKLSLGESSRGVFRELITLHNDSDQDVTYSLNQIEAFGLFPVHTMVSSPSDFWVSNSFPEFLAGGAPWVGFYRPFSSDAIDTIEVPAGATASFEVAIAANPLLPDLTVYGTYLVLAPDPDEDHPTAGMIVVPAAGITGDYQSQKLYLIEPFTGFVCGSFICEADPLTAFGMRDDTPGLFWFMDVGAERMVVEIVPVGDRAWLGPQPGFVVEFLPRNAASRGGYFVDFNDEFTKALPSGTYKFRVTALMPNGDPTNRAHVRVHETQPFVIDRFVTAAD